MFDPDPEPSTPMRSLLMGVMTPEDSIHGKVVLGSSIPFLDSGAWKRKHTPPIARHAAEQIQWEQMDA